MGNRIGRKPEALAKKLRKLEANLKATQQEETTSAKQDYELHQATWENKHEVEKRGDGWRTAVEVKSKVFRWVDHGRGKVKAKRAKFLRFEAGTRKTKTGRIRSGQGSKSGKIIFTKEVKASKGSKITKTLLKKYRKRFPNEMRKTIRRTLK